MRDEKEGRKKQARHVHVGKDGYSIAIARTLEETFDTAHLLDHG